jgi:hypothetical protein
VRKRTHRRHYALTNPISMAMSGCAITGKADLDKLRMQELSAIDAFAQGRASIHDWRSVADMSNLAETMAAMKIGRAEVLPAVRAVETALLETHARHENSGRIATTGPGLQAMRDLAEYHDLQRTSVDRRTYEEAIQRTINRVRSGHPDLKVVA